MEPVILCIDRGQTAVKAALFDMRGTELAVASQPCQPIAHPRPGWHEQDIDLMWEHAVQAIRQLLRGSGADRRIDAVSLSGQGGSVLLIDESGRPVRPGILSLDSRAEEIAAEFREKGLYRDASGFSQLVNLAWLKRNEPQAYARIRWVLGSKDWIRYKLTDRICVDTTDHPGVTEEYGRSYVAGLCSSLGIDEISQALPPILHPYEICGTVTEQAARLTGIPANTPVVVGAHDMMAAAYGLGGTYGGHISVLMGTLGICVGVVESLRGMPEHVRLCNAALPDRYVTTSSIGSAMKTLDWFADLLFPGLREGNVSAFYRELEARLAAAKPSSIIAHPYLMADFRNKRARAGLYGITAKHSSDDIMAGVYQGVAITMADLVRGQQAFIGTGEVWLTGGGAKSPYLCQILADCLGQDIHIAGSAESACRGAALCALTALGAPVDEKSLPPQVKCVYRPNSTRAGFYREMTDLYAQTRTLMEHIWSRQHALE